MVKSYLGNFTARTQVYDAQNIDNLEARSTSQIIDLSTSNEIPISLAGFINQNAGTINSGAGKHTDFISLENAKYFTVTTEIWGSGAGYAVYADNVEPTSSQKTCLGTEWNGNGSSTHAIHKNEIVRVEDVLLKYPTAKYIRFSGIYVSTILKVTGTQIVKKFNTLDDMYGYLSSATFELSSKALDPLIKIEDHTVSLVNVINGSFVLKTNGELKQFTTGKYTDYISTKDIAKFVITSQSYSSGCIVAAYDSNKKFIGYDGEGGGTAASSLVWTNKEIAIGYLKEKFSNIAYVRISTTGQLAPYAFDVKAYEYVYVTVPEMVHEHEEKINEISSSIEPIAGTSDILYDKTYLCFGDSYTSLTYDAYVDENGKVGKESNAYSVKYGQYRTYPVLIAERHNMKLINLARSGTRMYDPYNKSDSNGVLCKYYNTLSNQIISADYITIAHGLNDIGTAVNTVEEYETYLSTMGDSSSTELSTLFGAYNRMLNDIFIWNPTVKIGIIINDSWIRKPIHDTLLSVGEHWGIPVCDLKNDKNITYTFPNPNGERPELGWAKTRFDNPIGQIKVNILWNTWNYPGQQSHPNPKCHKFRSTIIENFMRIL